MEDSFLFHTVLSLAVAVGINLVWRYGPLLLKPKPPRNMHEFMGLLERGAIEVLRSDLYAIQCKAALVDYVGQIPDDFNPHVFMACNIGLATQRAVMDEAEALGLVPEGSFAKMFGRQSEPELEPARVSEPQLRLVTPIAPASSTRLPSTMWVNGRIAPRIRGVS